MPPVFFAPDCNHLEPHRGLRVGIALFILLCSNLASSENERIDLIATDGASGDVVTWLDYTGVTATSALGRLQTYRRQADPDEFAQLMRPPFIYAMRGDVFGPSATAGFEMPIMLSWRQDAFDTWVAARILRGVLSDWTCEDARLSGESVGRVCERYLDRFEPFEQSVLACVWRVLGGETDLARVLQEQGLEGRFTEKALRYRVENVRAAAPVFERDVLWPTRSWRLPDGRWALNRRLPVELMLWERIFDDRLRRDPTWRRIVESYLMPRRTLVALVRQPFDLNEAQPVVDLLRTMVTADGRPLRGGVDRLAGVFRDYQYEVVLMTPNRSPYEIAQRWELPLATLREAISHGVLLQPSAVVDGHAAIGILSHVPDFERGQLDFTDPVVFNRAKEVLLAELWSASVDSLQASVRPGPGLKWDSATQFFAGSPFRFTLRRSLLRDALDEP